MGRIRTIKPEFFRSRSLAKCPPDVRLTFAGLWTEADDHGRGIADPRILKGALWALDDDVTHAHVSAHLRMLDETGHITLYTVGDDAYFEVCNWTAHQAAAYRRGDPKFPGPDEGIRVVSDDGVQKSAGGTQEDAGTGNREGNREQGSPSADADAPSVEESFEQFWEVYPKRNGVKPGKGNALIEWRKLSLEQRRRAYRGAVNLAQSDQLPKDAERFLRRAKGGKGDFPFEDWQEAVSFDRDGNVRPLRVATCPKCDQAMASHDADICEVVQANG